MRSVNSSRVQSRPAREGFRLAKVIGVGAIVASAVSQEYGSGINFVAPQSVGVYPRIEGLTALAMFVTGVVLLPKVALFARFSRHLPRAGSTYTWLSRALSPGIGFALTFLAWVGIAGAIGVIAFTFDTFVVGALHSAGLPGAVALATPVGHLLVGLAAIWFVYAVHVRGVASYATFVRVLFGLILLTAVVVVGYGLLTPADHFLTAARQASGLPLQQPVGGGPTLSAFVSVCALFVFAYGGLNAAPTLGGEARAASVDVPRGVVLAWAVAVVLFTAVTFAVTRVAPWWAVSALVHHKHAAVTTVPGLIGLIAPRAVGVTMNALTALIVGKTLAPQMLGCSRTLFAWGQDRIVPSVFAETSKRQSPVAALTATAVVGSLFLAQTTYEGFTLGVIVRSISILLVLAGLSIAVFTIRFGQRSRFTGLDWAERIAAGPGIVAAAVAALVVAVLLITSVLTVAHKTLVFQPYFQTIVTLVLAGLIYSVAAARARRRGVSLRELTAEPPIE